MLDVFQIIPPTTITLIEDKLETSFATQAGLQTSSSDLVINPTNAGCKSEVRICEQSVESAEKSLEGINIETLDIFKSFNTNDKMTLGKSNDYYAMYGKDSSAENLTCSSDRILNTCEEPL